MEKYDVLIVGSGFAGLTAAISAKESGAEHVLIAEAAEQVGGSSRLSGGIIMGAGYSHQKASGIEDSGEVFYKDYMNANVWNVNPAAIRTFTAEAGPTIDWLTGHGVEFHPTMIYGGTENTPRCVAAVGQGQQMADSLARRARELGVDIALGQRVDRLVVEDGRVCGIAVGDDEILADAVVIASGGYGANKELLAKFNPSLTATEDWAWYIGADEAQGDALTFAEQVNANVVGFDRGLRLLHPNFVRTWESYIPAWMVLVNSESRRYVDESNAYGVLDRATHRAGGKAWFVFDHKAVDPQAGESVASYKQVMPEREDRRSPNWNPAMITEQVEAGRIHAADSIAELAQKSGLPAEQLEATIAAYNGDGVDEMGKDPRFVRPIDMGPFYAAEVRLATLCWTATGMDITENGQVVDTNRRPIPGLYAAGEATGGILGDVYVGSGNSVANSTTFGRLAGRAAATSRG